MFRREVQSLADIVAQCLRHDGLETPLRQRRLVDSWGKVVGNAVERYTGDKFIRNQMTTVTINLKEDSTNTDIEMEMEDGDIQPGENVTINRQ